MRSPVDYCIKNFDQCHFIEFPLVLTHLKFYFASNLLLNNSGLYWFQAKNEEPKIFMLQLSISIADVGLLGM